MEGCSPNAPQDLPASRLSTARAALITGTDPPQATKFLRAEHLQKDGGCQGCRDSEAKATPSECGHCIRSVRS